MSVRQIVRYAIAALAVVTVILDLQSASAQTYPNRKITIVVAFAAGGIADTMARLAAQQLSQAQGTRGLRKTHQASAGSH